jgi:hypothetical protein
MMGERRIKPWKHFKGEKSSQIDEEKLQQHLSKVEAPAPCRRSLSST